MNTINHIKFWIIITVTLQFKQRESDDEIIMLKWMLWLVCAYLGVALQGHVREGLSYQRVTLGFELILPKSFSFLLGVCCCLAENRFLLGEQNIPSKTKIRKLANHAKNLYSLYLYITGHICHSVTTRPKGKGVNYSSYLILCLICLILKFYS